MRKILLLATSVTVLLPGCQTWGPTWSEVTGQRYHTTILNRRPAIIERIDDQGSFATMPVKIEPGMKRVVLSAPTTGWTGGSRLEVFMLDAKPCKRYYLNAQFDDPLSPEFRPVIDFVEEIAGCTVEAKK
jgi:hypothetical protein